MEEMSPTIFLKSLLGPIVFILILIEKTLCYYNEYSKKDS